MPRSALTEINGSHSGPLLSLISIKADLGPACDNLPGHDNAQNFGSIVVPSSVEER